MKRLLLGIFFLSLTASFRPQTALAQPTILEYSMSPNKGVQGQFIMDTIAFPIQIATDCGFPYSVYLQHGNSIILGAVVNISAYPDTFAMSFNIPENADTSSYDLIMAGGISCEGDTEVDSNVFTIEAASASVNSIAFPDLFNSLHVFPNPAQDYLDIFFMMNAPSQVHLWLYDELGRTIATLCDGPLATGVQTFDCSCKDVPNGSYFYELTAGEEMYGGRIIVQH
jgi:hypothetical protein